jgi:glucose-6-phosphate-specific signal transduction histidine kinase
MPAFQLACRLVYHMTTGSKQSVLNTSNLNEELLTREQKITIYRICQERCTNIVKYAEARLVNIFLLTTDFYFTMEIITDGKGVELR